MSDGITIQDWLTAENFGRNDVLITIKDQPAPWQAPTYYQPPQEEEYEYETAQNWRTDPATAGQLATIEGLIESISGAKWPLGGESGEKLRDKFLEDVEKNMGTLNGEEAAGLVEVLGKQPPELWDSMLAWNKAETMGLGWPMAAILMGGGGATAAGIGAAKTGGLRTLGLPMRTILPKVGRLGGESAAQMARAIAEERFLGEPARAQQLMEYWNKRSAGQAFETPSFKFKPPPKPPVKPPTAPSAIKAPRVPSVPKPQIPKPASFIPGARTSYSPTTGTYTPRTVPKPTTSVQWSPKYGAPARGGIRTPQEAKVYREFVEQLSGKTKPTGTAESKALEKEIT